MTESAKTIPDSLRAIVQRIEAKFPTVTDVALFGINRNDPHGTTFCAVCTEEALGELAPELQLAMANGICANVVSNALVRSQREFVNVTKDQVLQ